MVLPLVSSLAEAVLAVVHGTQTPLTGEFSLPCYDHLWHSAGKARQHSQHQDDKQLLEIDEECWLLMVFCFVFLICMLIILLFLF